MSAIGPLPASAILRTLLSNYCKFRDVPCRVRAGCAAVDDDVLCGGVQRGVILGVSADIGGEGAGRVLSLHFGSSVLLSKPGTRISIIDTTGTFPVSLLADILRTRLTTLDQQGERLDVGAGGPGGGVEEKLQALLHRVEISRAFDIEGILEVLSEIFQKCNEVSDEIARDAAHGPVSCDDQRSKQGEFGDPDPDPDPDPDQEQCRIATGRAKFSQKVEITDSEAEDNEDDSELDSQPIDLDLRGTPSPMPSHLKPDNISPNRSTNTHVNIPPSGRIELTIIDNLTTPIQELLARKEKKDAHALLFDLSRKLQSLSQTEAMLLILLNSLTRLRSAASHQYHISSIFASTQQQPSLGQIFANLVALHIMITRVPLRCANAPDAPHFCHVLEVLKDDVHDLERWATRLYGPQSPDDRDATVKRRQSREQRWAPFALADGGLSLVPVEFEKGTNSKAKSHC